MCINSQILSSPNQSQILKLIQSATRPHSHLRNHDTEPRSQIDQGADGSPDHDAQNEHRADLHIHLEGVEEPRDRLQPLVDVERRERDEEEDGGDEEAYQEEADADEEGAGDEGAVEEREEDEVEVRHHWCKGGERLGGRDLYVHGRDLL